ncbi:MAG: hypothetical protein JXX29_00265 [Deltaproteobacteria bacterium]|nr:hypothetical protein [Deltaproteobacteria bacterium]MBN2670069.1 hypothetical protein [Deltaproteobacteria bacterium]
MSKRKKEKKVSGRSASAANRIAKTKKENFVKRPSIAKSVDEEQKSGMGVIKNLIIAIFVLVVGATILAKYSGASKAERGDLLQDAPCEATTECASGHVCIPFKDHPYTCKEHCKTDDECAEGYKCKPVVRFGKKRVKPMTVCVSETEL